MALYIRLLRDEKRFRDLFTVILLVLCLIVVDKYLTVVNILKDFYFFLFLRRWLARGICFPLWILPFNIEMLQQRITERFTRMCNKIKVEKCVFNCAMGFNVCKEKFWHANGNWIVKCCGLFKLFLVCRSLTWYEDVIEFVILVLYWPRNKG